MKTNHVTKVLELGAGHSRDTIFFASNGIEVEALDYSVIADEILDKIAKPRTGKFPDFPDFLSDENHSEIPSNINGKLEVNVDGDEYSCYPLTDLSANPEYTVTTIYDEPNVQYM